MSNVSRNPTAAPGAGKPPRGARWEKGRSGNPAGRPKKDESTRDIVKEELDARIRVQEDGKVITLSKRQLWVKRVVNGAIKGDPLCEKILMMIEKPEAAPRHGGGVLHFVDSEDEIPTR